MAFDWISAGLFGAPAGFAGLNKKKKMKRRSTLDPQQQKLYDDYIGSLRGEGPFSDLYNFDAQGANRNFDMNVEAPANRNFQENVIPQITGQFRGGNIMNSSYTGEALGRKGRDLQESLNALRSDMQFRGQQSSQNNRRDAIQNILNMTTFDYQMPGQSALDKILSEVGPSAARYATQYFAGG